MAALIAKRIEGADTHVENWAISQEQLSVHEPNFPILCVYDQLLPESATSFF